MQTSVLDRTARGPATCSTLANALASILEELRNVLSSIPREAYCVRMGAVFANATIGGHVRHCLDHARALVEGRTSGLIDYDHRARGTPIESDPAAAICEVDALLAMVDQIFAGDADESVAVAVMATHDGQTTVVASSTARELAFVLSHTIHHNATIRGMAAVAGHAVPESFGYAPSTLAHKGRCGCAR